MHWRRKWQPTPVSLPGEPQGRGSLVGCTESDTTEATQQQQRQCLYIHHSQDTQQSHHQKGLGLPFMATPTCISGPSLLATRGREFWPRFCFVFFWMHHVTCGILVPQPGMEPVPPELAMWCLNHWTTREAPSAKILDSYRHRSTSCP